MQRCLSLTKTGPWVRRMLPWRVWVEETPNHRVSPGSGRVGPAPPPSQAVWSHVTNCLMCRITFSLNFENNYTNYFAMISPVKSANGVFRGVAFRSSSGATVTTYNYVTPVISVLVFVWWVSPLLTLFVQWLKWKVCNSNILLLYNVHIKSF